jgi:hypothetical protein
MYPGLGVIDWQQYLDTIRLPAATKKVREAMRTLILTNRRLIVVDEARKLKTDLPLTDVEGVSVGTPPGALEGMPINEAMVQVAFRAHARMERRVVGWSTLRREKVAKVLSVLDEPLGVPVPLKDYALGQIVVEVDVVLQRACVPSPHDLHGLSGQTLELLELAPRETWIGRYPEAHSWLRPPDSFIAGA